MEIIKQFLAKPPLSTFLVKLSSDFIFTSVYVLLLGFAVIGIINLGMKIRYGENKPKKIARTNVILFIILFLFMILLNFLLFLLRK